MAKEHKRIELSSVNNAQAPDDLVRILADGWEVRRWSYNPIRQSCVYELEREVPDHEQKRT